jgi:hypothetical protein
MHNSPKRSGFARTLSLGLSAVLIAGVSLAGATSAQAVPFDTYSISGVVNDGNAAPLEGVVASVRIPDPGYSDTLLSDTTAVDGSFTLTDVPNGDYTVNFELDGYGYESVDVTVADGDVAVSTVTLLPFTDASGASATITGTGVLGTPLTVTTTGWPTGTEFTYQWFAPTSSNSGDISGATTDTYVVTEDVVGRNVWVWVYGEVPGVSAATEVTASNQVAASAPKEATAPAPTDLDAYLLANGSTPAAQTSAGLPAGALDSGTAYTANVSWDAADSFVDVYIYSTPTVVGTFAVVNGFAQITLSTAVLGQLAAGNHTLLVTGQTSGAVQSFAVAIGLAKTGADIPILPMTVASLLLLIGTALLIARRRIGQRV